MIEHAITFMQEIIAQYGAWGVLAATLLEEIVAPIPSPIVPLAAGFFLLPPEYPFLSILMRAAVLIALPVTVGISLGSSIVYALAYFGGKPIIEKTAWITGIKWGDLEKIEARLTGGRGDEIVLFLLRLIPAVPGVGISGFCGLVRYPFKTFLAITIMGSFLRALLLGLFGWQVGELYAEYADYIAHIEDYLLYGAIACIVVAMGWYIARNVRT